VQRLPGGSTSQSLFSGESRQVCFASVENFMIHNGSSVSMFAASDFDL
jgi:hypothetical protein